jgi:hypothetical protein
VSLGATIALSVGIATAAIVAAVWDAVRRALAAQVRQAEIRLEAMRREETSALADELAQVRERLTATESEMQSLQSAVVLRGSRR